MLAVLFNCTVQQARIQARHSLIAGQNWKEKIPEAIRDSRFFVAVLSKSMLQTRGYVHAEISDALEIRKEYPKNQIFFIPIRLDECEPSLEVSEIHWIDMFPSWEEGVDKILSAIFSQNLQNSIIKDELTPPELGISQ